MRAQRTNGQWPPGPPDRALWQRSRETEATEDEAKILLDLAGFADQRLDADDSERIAALLAMDPEAASDVAAARAVIAAGDPPPDAAARVVARALALVGDRAEPGRVVAFRQHSRPMAGWRGVASWGSLAAAIALAGWFGFDLGTDASVVFGQAVRVGDDPSLSEFLDPAPSLLRDLSEGSQT